MKKNHEYVLLLVRARRSMSTILKKNCVRENRKRKIDEGKLVVEK
jgi:hypothetical protein